MQGIRTCREGAVLVATLDRPDKKNALTGAMYDGLAAALAEAEGDAALGAVLIDGSGGSFSAGNDIADFLAYAGDFENSPAVRFIRRLIACDVPLVAAVEGAAIGVGTTMLLHCDVVHATETALFRMPFIDLGLVPEAAASLAVPLAFGLQRASELLLLGEALDVQRAHAWGLVNRIVAADRLRASALETATRLAAKPRQALRQTRRLIRGDRDALLARFDEEMQLFAAALRGPEARAAFEAFLARGPKG